MRFVYREKGLTIMNALNKLDDDYRVDYKKDTNQMLTLVHQLCSKMYARQFNVPEEWE